MEVVQALQLYYGSPSTFISIFVACRSFVGSIGAAKWRKCSRTCKRRSCGAKKKDFYTTSHAPPLDQNLGSIHRQLPMSLSTPVRRTKTTAVPSHLLHSQQIRHATLIRRPKRPYTFTQLVTLSDGSTYTHRTTSPSPIYKSTKDTRNAPLWNPSSQKLLSVEADEAGKLRAFREKFGRGWDASRKETERDEEIEGDASAELGQDSGEVSARGSVAGQRSGEDNLMDLISGYGREAEGKGQAAGIREGKAKTGKGKGGEK